MQSAKEKTTIAKFKEDVNFAYMELYSEGAEKGNYSEITVDKIIPRLKQNYGYTDENLHTQILGTVELKVPEEGNIEMATDSSKEVRVVTSDDNTKNYVKLDGMWYEFNITGDQVTVGKGNKEIPGESGNVNSSQLQAISNNGDVTTEVSTGTFIVTITSNENPTPQNQPAVITVSYGGSKIEINVTVKQAYTLTIGSNNTEYGTIAVSPTSENNKYIAGTELTITATPNEDYVFKGWYTGDDTTDDTKLISNAESSYTITLNEDTTLTAKFEIIDNSDSFAEGFVDYLGTRATIYLYANKSKISSGTITITMPDNTKKTITATNDNKNIGPNDSYRKYYETYTVAKDGIYRFVVKNSANSQTSTTIIKVSGIEKFTPIEQVKENGENLSYYNSENKAYNYKGAAVPKGYYVDINSNVETGLVITDSIDSEGYSTGNEWVWVPVNSIVGNDDYYGTEASDTALAGTTDVTYTKYSKLYSFTYSARENYGSFHTSGTTTGVLSRPSTTSNPGYREIAILTDSYYGETRKYNLVNNRVTGTAFTNVTDVAIQYRDDYNSMVASVDKYNGFYIGRYELAKFNENSIYVAKVQPGDSYTNETWYSLYNKCLTFGIKDSNNVQVTESSMMYGSLWDATMQWLVKSGISVGYTNYGTYGDYGNFYGKYVIVSNNNESNRTTIKVKDSSKAIKLQTGQTSYTRSNNIYDLSGNCYDWTQEASGNGKRVCRGGDDGGYSVNEDDYVAVRKDFDATREGETLSSRPQLYIK